VTEVQMLQLILYFSVVFFFFSETRISSKTSWFVLWRWTNILRVWDNM